MPEPNATPAPLTMTPGVAYGDRAAAEAAFSHASAVELRAALARWIAEADYWRNEAGGKAVCITLNAELHDATRAKLAEAEAIVVQSHCDLTTLNRSLTAAESRVAALTEALTGLAALVRGECPALLDEDSGGDARLALTIEAALSPSQDAKGGA